MKNMVWQKYDKYNKYINDKFLIMKTETSYILQHSLLSNPPFSLSMSIYLTYGC